MATEVMEAKKKEQHQHRQMRQSTRRSGKVLTPRADVYETQEQLIILADMPGSQARRN